MRHQALILGVEECDVIDVGGVALIGTEVFQPDRQCIVPGITPAVNHARVWKHQSRERQLEKIQR
jgi:hypothetical protein